MYFLGAFRRPITGTRLVFAAIAAVFAWSQTASAETRALLVGVSDYTYLKADLRGPRNDVRLMFEALGARGVPAANITVLSDVPPARVPGATTGAPTRAAILGHLARLAEVSHPGDEVIFYFSGHGSQMPDTNGDEQGGADEIFLPSDARAAKEGLAGVENALVDDELGAHARAVLATGAQMVAIIDACFSGTGFRAGPSAGVARWIRPEDLGLGHPLAGGADKAAGRTADLPGGFVFLYASQSDQRSFEYPAGPPQDPANWYGDFTRNLARVLRRVPVLSYRQLLQAARDGMRGAEATATQTPLGEGPLLDAPVFGSAQKVEIRLRVGDGRLAAGALDGIHEGDVFDLYAASAGGEPLGRARAATPAATSTPLRPLDGAPLPDAAYARLLSPGRPPPLAIDISRAHLGEPARARLAALGEGLGFRPVGVPGDGALLRFAEGLALTGPDGVLDPAGPGSSPRLSEGDAADTAALARWLGRIARARRLHRALTRAQSAAASGFSFSFGPPPVSGIILPGRRTETGACAKAAGAARDLADGVPLGDCARVRLAIRNPSLDARDVTVLYLDAGFSLAALWPRRGLSNRLHAGETRKLTLAVSYPADRDPKSGAAIEELIVLVVPAKEGAEQTVLTGLADGAPTRGLGGSGIGAYLARSLGDGSLRALPLDKSPGPVQVFRYRLKIFPTPDFDPQQ